jgi:hypothetical protein
LPAVAASTDRASSRPPFASTPHAHKPDRRHTTLCRHVPFTFWFSVHFHPLFDCRFHPLDAFGARTPLPPSPKSLTTWSCRSLIYGQYLGVLTVWRKSGNSDNKCIQTYIWGRVWRPLSFHTRLHASGRSPCSYPYCSVARPGRTRWLCRPTT